MSLPIPNLDDRRFQDIVDEAKRLIGVYCPEWTNLEPSDPGVALLELFAWLVESLSFRLNQVPDAFYTRMLDLMGVQPFPPRAARADLTFLLAPGSPTRPSSHAALRSPPRVASRSYSRPPTTSSSANRHSSPRSPATPMTPSSTRGRRCTTPRRRLLFHGPARAR